MAPISGFVLKENASVVKSVRNLDAKCEVHVSLHFLQLMQKKIRFCFFSYRSTY